jgi:UDP-N-acetylglucosamine 2-epimerase
MKTLITTIQIYITYLTRNHIKRAQIKSSNIFNVFNTTVTSLKTVNEQISSHIDQRTEAVKRLLQENKMLQSQYSDNGKIITKITEFFEK